MKKIYSLLIIFGVLVIPVVGQSGLKSISKKEGQAATATATKPSLSYSPQSILLLLELDKIASENRKLSLADSSLIKRFGIFHIQDDFFVSAFLVINDQFNSNTISILGGSINSNSKSIVTVNVPVDKLGELTQIRGIDYIQIGERAEIAMDLARASTWVDLVHLGAQLPQSYSGQGVVVGIIDAGFDYTHPNFFDASGTNNYRVKRVWEQAATTGTPPSGFNYGRELSNQTAILNAQRDQVNQSHGTHVAGIAAGAGGGVNTDYLGVAYESDLVFVATTLMTPAIVDGIQYIMNYANSVNKPCVINMSIGSHAGPHDGMSAFDVYCDEIIGNGKILVGSAGNEGNDPIHITKSYNSTDNTLFTFMGILGSNLTNGEGAIDIWGNPNQNYEVSVGIYNTNTDTFEDWTPYIQANSNNTTSYTLYDDDFFFPDPCTVTISSSFYPLNSKRNVQIIFDNSAQDDNYRWVVLEVRATTGQTKMWSLLGAQFTNPGYNPPTMGGSTNSTVGEIGGTGNSIISVGAYNTNVSQIGNIASFSSKGPTADNRTKPDITGPGNRITSSVSRFDNNYLSGGNLWNDVISGVTNGSNNWYFAQNQGTSMAAPMVTGILALWLQAYPELNHEQALSIIQESAWTDGFTGNIPMNGNNTWGWGKIDAHEGLLELLSNIPDQPTINPTGSVAFCQGESAQLSAPSGFSSYQWSNNLTNQSITVTAAGNYSVRVTNSQGYNSPWAQPTTVIVHSNPNSPTVSLNGDDLISSASIGNQWYLNGNIISGATGQTYTPDESGEYHVVVTNMNNCSSESNPISFTFVGNNDIEVLSEFKVYPNPTQGQINIQFPQQAHNVVIELYDASGRLQLQKNVQNTSSGNVEILSLENLSNGVYTMRIASSDSFESFRIVVSN